MTNTDTPGEGLDRYRHKKRGSEYVLLGIGKMQVKGWYDPSKTITTANVDMREVAIYRSVEDGSLWVRPREEFEDGRFEAIASPSVIGSDTAGLPSDHAGLVERVKGWMAEANEHITAELTRHDLNDILAALSRAPGAVERAAFKAGWRTNAVGEDVHSKEYLDGCEDVDWNEFKGLGIEAYLEGLAPPAPQPPVNGDVVARMVYDALEAADPGAYLGDFDLSPSGWGTTVDGRFDFAKIGAFLSERIAALSASPPQGGSDGIQ